MASGSKQFFNCVGCDTRFVLVDDGSSKGIIKVYLQW